MYVCIYIYIYIYVSVYTHTYIHSYLLGEVDLGAAQLDPTPSNYI